MNQAVKEKWLEALRSGEYKQGQQMLKRNQESEDYYCCLGVLCDIHSKETGVQWVNGTYREEAAFLPASVRDWASLTGCDPMVLRTHPADIGRSLSAMNDGGTSFAGIADIIERDL